MEVICSKCGQKNFLESADPATCQHCQAEIMYTDEGCETIIGDRTEAPRSATNHPEIPKQFGRYEVLEEIGRGGMGVVYKGYDTKLKRTVALKILLHVGDVILKRFLLEAQTMAALDHPNIIKIYDVGEEEKFSFIVMDFIKGISLREFLQHNTLSPQQATSLILKIAQAVYYAHSKGVVHRDLKPANIMFNENNEPMVMDFGLAKLQQSADKLSQSGVIMGTFLYMSPEQANGESDIDHRADIYALGTIFYEILSGRAPFHGDTTFHLIKQILCEKPPEITKYRPTIPRVLQDICMKALAKNKEERYQTAQDLAADLQKFLDGDQVTIPPPRISTQNPQNLKRGIYSTIAILVVILGSWLLISGKAQSTWQHIVHKISPPPPLEWPAEFWKRSWNGKYIDFTSSEWQQLSLETQVKYAHSYQRWYAAQHDLEVEKNVKIANLDFVFVLIPPGKFWMGTPLDEEDRGENETRHAVLISHPLWMGKYEVTQGQWRAVMGSITQYEGDNRPVFAINWNQCQQFCEKTLLRLPSEAEWEYTCRAGTTTAFNLGDNIGFENINYNSEQPYKQLRIKKRRWRTIDVGSLENANSWGCYDMHGNLSEWCLDDYEEYKIKEEMPENPMVKNNLGIKLARGGGRHSSGATCRSGYRQYVKATAHETDIGFRVVLPVKNN